MTVRVEDQGPIIKDIRVVIERDEIPRCETCGTHNQWTRRTVLTEWPPEAKKRGADALYRLRWGDHPPSQNAAIYAQCEKEAELAQAAGWETLTGDNK